MDSKTEQPVKRDWSWLPAFMPSVARILADKRAEHGKAWVNECWKQGVTLRKPGHFWAAEGAVAIGVPSELKMVDEFLALQRDYPDAGIVVIPNPPEGWNGGNSGA
jgi:hypothetical protein